MAVLDVEFGADYASYEVKELDGSYVDHASVDLYFGQTVVQNHWYTAAEVAGKTSFGGTFTGLQPGTSYTIWEYVWDANGNLVSQKSSSFVTTLYPIAATVNFDANGGTVSPASATGSGQSQTPEGNVQIEFPTPYREGYALDYWQLSYGSTIYQTPYYPGINSIYATSSWPYYTATAIWRPAGAQATIFEGSDWHNYQAQIFETRNGVSTWWPFEGNIYDGGWQ